MDKEKSKLRLRKPVIISIPIILIILVLSTILLVNKDKLFAKTIESEKQEQSGFNEAYTSYRLSDSEYFKAFGKLIEDRKNLI